MIKKIAFVLLITMFTVSLTSSNESSVVFKDGILEWRTPSVDWSDIDSPSKDESSNNKELMLTKALVTVLNPQIEVDEDTRCKFVSQIVDQLQNLDKKHVANEYISRVRILSDTIEKYLNKHFSTEYEDPQSRVGIGFLHESTVVNGKCYSCIVWRLLTMPPKYEFDPCATHAPMVPGAQDEIDRYLKSFEDEDSWPQELQDKLLKGDKSD